MKHNFFISCIRSVGFLFTLWLFCGEATTLYAHTPGKFLFWGRKKPKTEAPISDYRKLTGRDTVEIKGVAGIVRKENDYYFELPTRLFGREFLVVNRLQQVPKELNESGVNKGINYETQSIRFEWDRPRKQVLIRQKRTTPEVAANAAMARSVRDNYLDPIIAALKIEAWANDSSTLILKANELFDGRKNCLNDVFNHINLGTSPSTELSRIIDIKAFENNITATSELTTIVHEGKSKVNVTVQVSTSLALLPELPMRRREENQRVGYFTTSNLVYSDAQQSVETKNYITRWRLEPKDTAAYMRGDLIEPIKPIVFYIDRDVPQWLVPYMREGILDWNAAFEKAGFRNAIRVEEYTDSLAKEGDDIGRSVLTYAASTKANAMGPSVVDPRSGEILEADIIWWHNVQSLIREWIMVQTGAGNPEARSLQMPRELIGDAVRFVACHEVGHSLGLRHNMMASHAYPTDSLRSPEFTNRMKGTSASIMDYARFNYVAQPQDGVTTNSPHIGPYDLMAIEWGYRWYPAQADEKRELHDFLQRHSERKYRYSEAQQQRSAIDPRALSEDLGDDAVKSATLGIANLKKIMPNIVEWTRTGEIGQTYDEAAKFYSAIIYQWGLFHYHVMANIGGMYVDNVTIDDTKPAFTFVEKEKQRAALQFLMDEVLTYPKWLFGTSLTNSTYLQRVTPLGTEEQHPHLVLRNQQNYVLWDLLDNGRLVRMFENELQQGKAAFTAVEMMDMLHKHIFAKTISGGTPDVQERSLQKSFVDALITAAAESEGVKINKKIYAHNALLESEQHRLLCREEACCGGKHNHDHSLSSAPRRIEMSSTQIGRNSDAISVKRGELLRVMKLLKSKLYSGDTATRLHYEDVVLRIQTALGLSK